MAETQSAIDVDEFHVKPPEQSRLAPADDPVRQFVLRTRLGYDLSQAVCALISGLLLGHDGELAVADAHIRNFVTESWRRGPASKVPMQVAEFAADDLLSRYSFHAFPQLQTVAIIVLVEIARLQGYLPRDGGADADWPVLKAALDDLRQRREELSSEVADPAETQPGE